MAGFEINSKKTRKPKTSLAERLMSEFEKAPRELGEENHDNVLILGDVGTLKSGSVLEYLLKDIKKDEKIFVCDIDASNFKLINKFHKDSYNKGHITYFDPYVTMSEEETGNQIIDYKATTENCKATAEAIRLMLEKGDNFKAVVVDGISLLLEFAEFQMRTERDLDADDGVSLKIYKLRAKIFNDITTMFARLKLPVFFIGHRDFLANKDGELASAKQKLHALNDAVLDYSRDTSIKSQDVVVFEAKVLKNRNSIAATDKIIQFAEVNNKTKVLKWDPRKIFDSLEEDVTKAEEG